MGLYALCCVCVGLSVMWVCALGSVVSPLVLDVLQPAGDPFSSLGVLLCSVMLAVAVAVAAVAVAVCAVAVAACCCLFLCCVALFGEHVVRTCYLLVIYLVMREASMRMSVVLFSHVLLASAEVC